MAQNMIQNVFKSSFCFVFAAMTSLSAVTIELKQTPILTANLAIDSTGSFLRIVRPSEFQRGFFRAVEPNSPPESAYARGYPADPAGGVAGFASVRDDMPLIYQQGYIAAASEE
ncbi:MAG: hypothetical protein QNL33_00015 [Akkermansiaceae bacterium]|jgi:hypothetical protein